MLFRSLPGSDPQRQAKARCALRAVLREIEVDRAARVAGLGNQLALLQNLPEGLAALVDEIVGRQPKRQRVVASALTRLFAWCREVDADPLSVTPTDLPQFRRWLLEVGTTVPESMVVAADFLALRHSPIARELLAAMRQSRISGGMRPTVYKGRSRSTATTPPGSASLSMGRRGLAEVPW